MTLNTANPPTKEARALFKDLLQIKVNPNTGWSGLRGLLQGLDDDTMVNIMQNIQGPSGLT
eukprot:711235-Alexandrium_andersonii.AAC.1